LESSGGCGGGAAGAGGVIERGRPAGAVLRRAAGQPPSPSSRLNTPPMNRKAVHDLSVRSGWPGRGQAWQGIPRGSQGGGWGKWVALRLRVLHTRTPLLTPLPHPATLLDQRPAGWDQRRRAGPETVGSEGKEARRRSLPPPLWKRFALSGGLQGGFVDRDIVFAEELIVFLRLLWLVGPLVVAHQNFVSPLELLDEAYRTMQPAQTRHLEALAEEELPEFRGRDRLLRVLLLLREQFLGPPTVAGQPLGLPPLLLDLLRRTAEAGQGQVERVPSLDI